jgi:predicted transcriptional regulator
MLSQIDALARDQDRDRSYIMRKAIAEYLARISADGNAAFCAQGVPRQERAGTTT